MQVAAHRALRNGKVDYDAYSVDGHWDCDLGAFIDWYGTSPSVSTRVYPEYGRDFIRGPYQEFPAIACLQLLPGPWRGLCPDCSSSSRCLTADNFMLTKRQTLLIVIHLTFIHERSKAVAILWSIAGLLGTGFVGLIPYISDHGKEWHPYYRYWTIPSIISVVLVFFLFPETYFKRSTVAFDGLIVLQSATEKLTIFKDIDADSDIYRDLPELPSQAGLFGRYTIGRSPFASWRSMGRCCAQAAFCFISPLIFWVAIAIALNYTGMIFIAKRYSRVLGEAPYKPRSEKVALVNLASAVGGLFVYPIGVIPVQRVLDRLTKRNHGVQEAEHYLVGLILPVITGATSSFMYGSAVQHSLHLTAYYFSHGLNGFSWVTMAIATTVWATEALSRWAAPALAAMSGAGFMFAFALSLVFTP
jgi:hypothetical protein